MLAVLAKDSVIYGAGKLSAAALGIITVPFFTRVFTPEEYGAVNVVFTFSALLGMLVSLSLPTAYSRYHADERYDHRQLFASLFVFILLFGGVLSAAALTVGYWVDTRYLHSGYVTSLLPAVLLGWIGQLVLLQAMVLRMARQPLRYISVTLTATVTGALGAVMLVAWQARAEWYFWGALLGQVAGLCIGTRLLDISVRRHALAWWHVSRDMLRFSVPLVPAALAQYALSSTDRWMLAFYHGNAVVAQYTVAFKIASVIGLLTSVVMFAFVPHAMQLIQQERAVASEQLERLLRQLSALFFVSVIGVTLLSPVLLAVFAPPSYQPALALIGPLALSNVLFSFTYFSTLGSWKADRAADYSWAILAGVAINLLVNLVFIPRFGALAASVSSALAMAVTVVVSFRLSALRYRYGYAYIRLLLSTGLTSAWVMWAVTQGAHVSLLNVEAVGLAMLMATALAAINLRRDEWHWWRIR